MDEGQFLENLRQWGYINVPNVITKENVNTRLQRLPSPFPKSLLWLAVGNKRNIALVKYLLSLGADTESCLGVVRDVNIATTLIDAGATASKMDWQHIVEEDRKEELWMFFIDYGINIPEYFRIQVDLFGRFNNVFTERLYDIIQYYDYSVTPRITRCRQSLLFMFYACSVSNFRPLVGIFLSAARQTWAMRGGCGPRAHDWFIH